MNADAIFDFPASLLSSLPSPVKFDMYHHESKRILRIFTCEVASPGDEDVPVIDGIELDALVAGVEAGRVWPRDLNDWLLAKAADPSARMVQEAVMGGAHHATKVSWTLGRVAAHLGLELRGWAPVDTTSSGAALAA